MSELPRGWDRVRVGDLVEIGPRTECHDETVVGFVPLHRLGVTFRSRHTFEPRSWSEVRKGYTHFADGDVLLARITPSFENGKAGIARDLPNGLGAGSTEYFVCRTRDQLLLPEYLLAHFKTRAFLRDGEQVMSGAVGQQRVPKQYVLDSEIPLAPFNEQKRIADKLDTLLARVDACRERLDRVPALLKRFRQSVLAAATSGELTREWREARGLDDAWEQTTVEKIIDGKPRNGYSPRAVEHVTSVKSLTLTATTSGRFRGEHFKYIDESIPADSHLWLRPGDVLIQRANTLENVGVSAIFDGPEKTFIYPDLMMKCRANERVLPAFLHLVLSSQPVRNYFRENATGTAGNMPKINQQTVLSAPAVIPPLAEQREIVIRTAELLSLADALERSHDVAAMKVKTITPATLAKAFRGELVPQNPNDEPASKLLARLRSAGASADEPSKAKRGPKRGKAASVVTTQP